MIKIIRGILNRWKVREYKRSIDRLEHQAMLFEIPYELALTVILRYKVRILELEAGRD